MKTFESWTFHQLNESTTAKYSVEVNYRTNTKEVLENYAKIALGYVSAIIKSHDLHVKQVYDEKPVRILVSERNWDDGEWCIVVIWNTEHNCFVASKGFYNKDRATVSIQKSEKCVGDSASDVAKHVMNMMHNLKDEPNRHAAKLKPVPLKRGPK
jgi:hypothetical protein